MSLVEYLKKLPKAKQEKWARENLMFYVKLKIMGYDPEVDHEGFVTAWIPESDLAKVNSLDFSVVDKRMIS